MYAMIHSAENVYRQQEAEMVRNLERARILKEHVAQTPAPPRISIRARLVAALHHGRASVPSAGPIASAH